MSERDARAELAELVTGFRVHLEAAARGGAIAAPGGPSPRPAPQPGAQASSAASTPAPQVAESTAAEPPQPAVEPAPGEVPAPPRSLGDVRAALGDCQRCKLAGSRTHIVFGVGSEAAPLMFIGEAPGAEEDRRGEPFVGRAGQLLDRMIAAMGWTRDAVYIANVLKCRPPGNRDPQPAEVAACEPFLARQIEAIGPRVLVTLGKPAAHLLLRTSAPISALRGRFQAFRGIPVMPTFHPAFLLRKPERKRETWADLQQVMAELERLGVRPPA